jgi:histidine triad (HIT) family protein
MVENCLFCKIIRGEIPANRLFEDDEVLAFRDIAPVAPLHFLIIPKKHINGPAAIPAEEEYLLGKMLRIGKDLAQQEGIEHFRVVLNNGEEAGQTVFHLHMHIIGGRSLNWPPG